MGVALIRTECTEAVPNAARSEPDIDTILKITSQESAARKKNLDALSGVRYALPRGSVLRGRARLRSLRAIAEVRAYRRDPKGAGHMRDLRELVSDIELSNVPLETVGDLGNNPVNDPDD